MAGPGLIQTSFARGSHDGLYVNREQIKVDSVVQAACICEREYGLVSSGRNHQRMEAASVVQGGLTNIDTGFIEAEIESFVLPVELDKKLGLADRSIRTSLVLDIEPKDKLLGVSIAHSEVKLRPIPPLGEEVGEKRSDDVRTYDDKPRRNHSSPTPTGAIKPLQSGEGERR